mgnify:CR=1 FL=1
MKKIPAVLARILLLGVTLLTFAQVPASLAATTAATFAVT